MEAAIRGETALDRIHAVDQHTSGRPKAASTPAATDEIASSQGGTMHVSVDRCNAHPTQRVAALNPEWQSAHSTRRPFGEPACELHGLASHALARRGRGATARELLAFFVLRQAQDERLFYFNCTSFDEPVLWYPVLLYPYGYMCPRVQD